MVYKPFARVLHVERKSRYAAPVSAFLYGNKNIAVIFVELNTPCIKITIDTDKFQVPIGVFGSFFSDILLISALLSWNFGFAFFQQALWEVLTPSELPSMLTASEELLC